MNVLTIYRRVLLFLTIVFASSQVAYSQNSTCSFQDEHNHLLQTDPGYEQLVTTLQKEIKQALNGAQKSSGNNYLIPVVFHIVYGNDMTTNISDAQVLSQFARLNAEFAGNPNSVTGEDMQIQFCMAPNTPDGISNWNAYGGGNQVGITRHQDVSNTVINTGSHNGLVSQYGFPPDQYLNIYVIEEISGNTLGYSNFSGQLGVVIESQIVGDQSDPSCGCTLLNNYHLGMALVHEVGHYLALPHTWGLGGCQSDDGIDDTPTTAGQNYGCPTGVNSCVDPNNDQVDMIENYMDYTFDPCKNAFSEGQRCVMHAQIQNNQFISDLVSIQNLLLTGVASPNGCIDPGLVPQFTVENPLVCTNEAFDITLLSNITLDSWELIVIGGSTPTTFSGGVTTGNIIQSVTLTDPGSYSLAITYVSTAYSPSSATAVFNDVLFASECTPICDGAMWHFPKYSNNGNDFLRLNFSNGVVAEAVQATPSSTQISGGTYTYSDCGGGFFFTDGKDTRNADGTHVLDGNNTFTIPGCAVPTTNNAPSDRQGVIGIPNGDDVTVFMLTEPITSATCNPVAMGMSHFTIDPDGDAGAPLILNAYPGISPGENYSFASGITAIPHCDAGGTWIIAKGAGTADPNFNPGPSNNPGQELFAYLFDGMSLSAPVVSNSGPYVINGPAEANAYVEASPDGRWVIYSSSVGSHIYEFNALTGTFVYKADIDGSITAFSTSGNLLYALDGATLLQYDFNHFRNCCEFLPPEVIDIAWKSQMQRGPDGKIYMWGGSRFVSVINSPDMLIEDGDIGLINLMEEILEFPAYVTNSPTNGIPNFIESSTSMGIDFYCCVTNCREVSFRAEGCSDGYQWDLGNGDMPSGSMVNTIYQTDGIYTVTVTGSNGMTLTKDIHIGFPVPLEILPEGNICMDPTMTYNINVPDMEYIWSVPFGGTLVSDPSLPFATVVWADQTIGGTVCVTVFDPTTECTEMLCFDQDPCVPCVDLTVTAVVTPACLDDGTITLTVTGGSGQYIFEWDPSTLPPASMLTDLAPGTYSVKVVDSQAMDCTGELTIVVLVDPNCGGGCTADLTVHHLHSPDPFCFESDANFTDYYINIHVPNWGNTQQEEFEFCPQSANVEFSVGELLEPFIEVGNGVLEIEGFLRIPTSNQTTEVCVTFPVCVKGVGEKCAEFCFDLEPCDPECWFEVESEVTQTYLGPATNAPCGISDPKYNIFQMDFLVTVTLPVSMVGDHINVQLWSDVGQQCNPFMSYSVLNAPQTFTVNFSSLFNMYDAKHFCYHITVKNKTTGHRCEENFCEPLVGAGFFAYENNGKGKTATSQLGVYPTLTNDFVNVTGIQSQGWEYRLYSVSGQLTSTGVLNDKQVQQINLTSLRRGSYLLELKNPLTHERQAERVVKQ